MQPCWCLTIAKALIIFMNLNRDHAIIYISFISNFELEFSYQNTIEYPWKPIVYVWKYPRASSLHRTDCLESVFLNIVAQKSSIKCLWVCSNMVKPIWSNHISHEDYANAMLLMGCLCRSPSDASNLDFCWPINLMFMTELTTVSTGANWTWDFNPMNSGISGLSSLEHSYILWCWYEAAIV